VGKQGIYLSPSSPLPYLSFDFFSFQVIEARPSGVNKGAAARRLISEYNPDFVLCIGDDKTGTTTTTRMA
jgi:hydroxymethylpyrimidine pyrophosphatase-like HAD family hydrolase